MKEGVRIIRTYADLRDFKLVVIVAGEASADLHGSNLVKAIRALDSGVIFCGIGGEKMKKAGVKTFFSSSEMAVVGLTEVFSRLHTIVRASIRLKSILKNERPDLLVLIDYPDFNIHIARTAKRFKIPVLYYISPQIWAWRSGRIRKIARRVDRMAVILPFEEELYKQRFVKADYVGHPLLDVDSSDVNKEQIKIKLGAGEYHPVVGLLPGSRKEEIKNLLPVMVHAAEIMTLQYPDIRCCLPLAETIPPDLIYPIVEKSPIEIKIFRRNISQVLGICDVALVASGTATLETAIMGIPMVIVYKVSPSSYWMGKIVIKVPHIGLPNLVAGEEVVPELIQSEVTANRLAHEALTILQHDDIRKNMIKKLQGIRQILGSGGASDRTAKIALKMMEK